LELQAFYLKIILKMKIGIDARCLQKGENTGVQEYTRSLIVELIKKNEKDDFVLFLNSFNEVKEKFDWLKDFKNIEIKRFNWPNKILNFCFWFLNWPKIDKMLGDVEVFITPNFNFLALSSGTKLIVIVHDLSFERFPETFSVKRRLWHFMINPRKTSKKADKIWAVSHSTAEDLTNLYGIKKNKITVNYPFFNFKNSIKNKEILKKVKHKYKLPNEFIFFLGTIEPRKNIEGLLDGFEAFKERNPWAKECKLVVAGEKGWLWKSILEKAQKNSFAKDILFIGFVEERDKPEIYFLSKAFVYPSLYEGFGFPPLEAMICGVPTVASNCSSMPEILEDGALLINPYKPFEICLALENLFQNKQVYEVYSEKGKKQAKKIANLERNFEYRIYTIFK